MKKLDKVKVKSSGESGIIQYKIPTKWFNMYNVRLDSGRYVNVMEQNLSLKRENNTKK